MIESPIKKLRKKLDLSQSQFARLVGVSQSHISEIECGISKIDEKVEYFLYQLSSIEPDEIIEEQLEFIEYSQQKLSEKVREMSEVPEEST